MRPSCIIKHMMLHYVDVRGNVLLGQSPLVVMQLINISVVGFLTAQRPSLNQFQEDKSVTITAYITDLHVLDRFRGVSEMLMCSHIDVMCASYCQTATCNSDSILH